MILIKVEKVEKLKKHSGGNMIALTKIDFKKIDLKKQCILLYIKKNIADYNCKCMCICTYNFFRRLLSVLKIYSICNVN